MRFIQIVVVVAALSMLVTGVWMRIDPASFAQWANWPNHVHFLHDAGVFQIGIAVTMLFALWWRDVIAVVLTGFLVATRCTRSTTTSTATAAIRRTGGSSGCCRCWPRPRCWCGCVNSS